MVGNLEKYRFLSNLPTGKKIIILIIICCLVLGGLSPTIHRIIINDNSNKNGNNDPEYKKTGVEDDVVAIASFLWEPRYPDPGEVINFNSNSYALRGYIYREIWDFGDGARKSGRAVTHSFEKKGSYRVTLTIKARGYQGYYDWDSTSSYVNVGEDPFPRIICTPEDPLPGEQVTIDGTNSYDPDGNIASYNWSFYNENSPENVTYLGSEQTVYYTWENQGIYHICLTITDDKENENTFEKVIHVSILKIEGFKKFSRKIVFEVHNYGNVTANNIRWNIEVEKYPLSNLWSRRIYQDSGEISIVQSGSYESVRAKRIRRAFCKLKIDVTAEADNAVSISKTFYGVAFGKNLYITEENFANPYTIIVATGLVLTLISLFFLMSFGFPFI